jgi:hypothetical protein
VPAGCEAVAILSLLTIPDWVQIFPLQGAGGNIAVPRCSLAKGHSPFDELRIMVGEKESFGRGTRPAGIFHLGPVSFFVMDEKWALTAIGFSGSTSTFLWTCAKCIACAPDGQDIWTVGCSWAATPRSGHRLAEGIHPGARATQLISVRCG